jgi:hypothetical protein
MSPDILRMVERILVVAVGGVSVYLGYRLFLKIPSRLSSEGRVALPGGTSIFITRVGPGSFFALFGTILVALSFLYPVTITPVVVPADPSTSTPPKVVDQFQGVGPSPTPGEQKGLTAGEQKALELDELSNVIRLLNTLPSLLKPDPNEEDRRRDVMRVIPKIKVSLMRQHWLPEWGDLDAFERWVGSGELEAPPEQLKRAVDLYRLGQEKP